MRTLLRTIVLAAPLLLASLSPAQFGGRGAISEAARPDVLPRDAVLIMDTLKLEEWQRPIVESLIEDYTFSFKTGWETAVQKMKEFASRMKGGSGGAKGMMQPIAAWLPEKKRLYDEFMANVKGQLSDVQLERWPKFERAMRREKALEDSDLAGEGLDLGGIVRQMQLPKDAADAAQPAIDAYEVELDTALVQRDATIDGLVGPLTDAMEGGDVNRGFELQTQIMNARVGVRNVQDGWIEKIAEALPESYGPQFRERALGMGYREAYQPDMLAPFFQTVLALPSLTSEQRSAVEAIQTKWSGQLQDLRDRMVAALRQDGPLKPKRDAAARAAKSGGDPSAGPKEAIVPLRAEKSKLANATREEVKALLTPEQVEGLAGGDPNFRPPVPAMPGPGKGGAPIRTPMGTAPDETGETPSMPEGRKPGAPRPPAPANPGDGAGGDAPKDPPQ